MFLRRDRESFDRAARSLRRFRSLCSADSSARAMATTTAPARATARRAAPVRAAARASRRRAADVAPRARAVPPRRRAVVARVASLASSSSSSSSSSRRARRLPRDRVALVASPRAPPPRVVVVARARGDDDDDDARPDLVPRRPARLASRALGDAASTWAALALSATTLTSIVALAVAHVDDAAYFGGGGADDWDVDGGLGLGLGLGGVGGGIDALAPGSVVAACLWSFGLFFKSPLQILLVFLGRTDTERPSDWLLRRSPIARYRTNDTSATRSEKNESESAGGENVDAWESASATGAFYLNVFHPSLGFNT